MINQVKHLGSLSPYCVPNSPTFDFFSFSYAKTGAIEPVQDDSHHFTKIWPLEGPAVCLFDRPRNHLYSSRHINCIQMRNSGGGGTLLNQFPQSALNYTLVNGRIRMYPTCRASAIFWFCDSNFSPFL
jgi:hypothetical protein